MSTLERPAADPRSAVAAFFSFLFPGLGQAYNGERRLAGALAFPVLLLIGLTLLGLIFVRTSVLARFLDTRFLVALVVLDVGLMGWRLVAIGQAHAARSSLTLRRWTGWVTGLLLATTVAMHLVTAWYGVKAVDTLNAVAQEGSGGVGGLPGASALPIPSDQPDVELGERVNVLLVGVDSGPGRDHSLTDTMLLVSIDPRGGHSAMVSVPRDLYGVPLPDGRVFNAKLNSLMSYAAARPDEFPLGGVGTLKETIGDLLGLKVHYFGSINLLGFKDAVDAVGGVDITVERAINDPTYSNEYGQREGFFIEPGEYHMDGHMALAYVRSRKGAGDSDFTRADRQQRLIAALREKLTAGNLVLSLPSLLDAVKATISTDVPADRLPALAAAVQDADMTNLQRVVLQPPTYMTANPNSAAGYILVPDLEAIHAVGEQLLTGELGATPTPSPSP